MFSLGIAGKLLASYGLPKLVKLVMSSLNKLDNPIAQEAAKALKGVSTSIDSGEISQQEVASANAHIEAMRGLEVEETTKIIESVNATMRVEATSQHWWVSAWRPFWGAASAVAFVICILCDAALAFYALKTGQQELLNIIPSLVTAQATLFAVPGAILGVASWHRGKEKRIIAGETQQESELIKVLRNGFDRSR